MDPFLQRKKDVLSKKDKSSIGKWDNRIVSLCEQINRDENYYTTSSCSGRIMILKDEGRKSPGLFEFVSHELVFFEEFIEELKKIKEGNFKFKQESFILHVACRDLESAKILIEKVVSSGIKRCGIISLGKNFIVEINSTERIEFPLFEKGVLLVDESFLRLVLKKANFNLEKGWEKMDRLEGFL